MRDFENTNPIVITVYFLAVSGVCMFSMHPILLALSFFGAVAYSLVRGGLRSPAFHALMLLIFLIGALINPLVSSAGATRLFFINDSPVTLEAIAYGIAASAAVVGVIYWFRSYTQIMTSDKLLYTFGKLSPRLSLVLSMIIGRLVWGAAQFCFMGLAHTEFSLAKFWAGAVTEAIPGIILQLAVIPVLVMMLKKIKGYKISVR